MKTVEMLEDFTSYPNGKDERAWKKGDEDELSNEHAALLIDKGLARETGGKGRKPAEPNPPTTDDSEGDAK